MQIQHVWAEGVTSADRCGCPTRVATHVLTYVKYLKDQLASVTRVGSLCGYISIVAVPSTICFIKLN